MSEKVKKEKRVKKPKGKVRKILEWVITGIFLVLFAIVMAGQIDGMVHRKDHYGKDVRFGYGTFIVETDSMAPQYKVKTALITHLDSMDKIYEDFNNGETIDLTFVYTTIQESELTKPTSHPDLINQTNKTYDPEVDKLPMTHRVVEIHINENKKVGQGRYMFITAGINRKSTWLGWKEGEPEITITQYQAFTEKEVLGRVVINSPFLGGVFKFVSSVLGLLILLLIPAFYLVITSVLDIFKAYKDPEEVTAKGKSSNTDGSIELSEEDKKRLKEELLQEMINKKKGEK